jgi:hypothetical protein
MINWLTRRRNPTPYFSLLPTEVGRYGEDRILEALRKDRPDLIAVVHRDTREYGVRYFGENYGVEIGRWIPLTYRYLHNSGATPLHDEHFGIQLLIRADRAR